MTRNTLTSFLAAVLLAGGMALAPQPGNGAAISPAADPASAAGPRFTLSLRPDVLTLAGHAASPQEEQALLAAAGTWYPKHRIESRLQPLGGVPDAWAHLTQQLLKVFQTVHYGDAELTPDSLLLRAIVDDAKHWQDRLAAFRDSLPPATAVQSEMILADPGIDVTAVCERAFASFDPGPINFEESSAEFRSSALPRLDRLVALAAMCSDAGIRITGHTDASGDETWNRQLSLLRAAAVADYLESNGIDRGRIDIGGVGSDEPIASNHSRYGRSLNRRIEIDWSSAD